MGIFVAIYLVAKCVQGVSHFKGMHRAWRNHHAGLKEERLNEMVSATEVNSTPAIEMEDQIPSVSINMEDVLAMPQNISRTSDRLTKIHSCSRKPTAPAST